MLQKELCQINLFILLIFGKILKKKRTSNPIFFDQNYEQKWVGCSDGALVDINKLMATRVLDRPLHQTEDMTDEFYIGVDVARSENSGNNQSAISVIRIERNKNTNYRVQERYRMSGKSEKTAF